MSVHEFELFHGVALAKIMRSDSSVSLLLTETKPSSVWAAYELNAEIVLYIKHSTTPKRGKRKSKRKTYRWLFTFGPPQLEQISNIKKPVWVALVCGSPKLGKGPLEVCLLDPSDVTALVDLNSTGSQWARVEFESGTGKRLRAYGSNSAGKPRIIPRNRLETWVIPGS